MGGDEQALPQKRLLPNERPAPFAASFPGNHNESFSVRQGDVARDFLELPGRTNPQHPRVQTSPIREGDTKVGPTLKNLLDAGAPWTC